MGRKNRSGALCSSAVQALSLCLIFMGHSLTAQKMTLLSLDSSYCHIGYTIVDLAEEQESLKNACYAKDGSVWLWTSVSPPNQASARLYHVLPNGKKDISFNKDTGYFSPSKWLLSKPADMVLDSAGKILVLAKLDSASFSYPSLSRVNENGTEDLSYKGTTNMYLIRNRNAKMKSMSRDRKGNIFIAGDYRNFFQQDYCLVMKLNPKGELDKTFAETGILFVKGQSSVETCNKIVVDTLGRLYLLGATNAGISMGQKSRYLSNRILSSGLMDDLYGRLGTGKTYFYIGTNAENDAISEAVLDNKQNVLAVCDWQTVSRQTKQLALARLLPFKGHLDTTYFSRNGIWTLLKGAVSSTFTKVQVDRQSRIYALGYLENKPKVYTSFILRLEDNGSIDTSFADKGFYYLDVLPNAKAVDFILKGDTITVFGNCDISDTSSKTFIARLIMKDKWKPKPSIESFSLEDTYISCQKAGYPLSVSSNSQGRIEWDVVSGNAFIKNDSLFVKASKNVTLRVKQAPYNEFTSIEVVFELSVHCDLLVYEFVSPNGDGKNDYFSIKNLDFFENNRVTVLNKWQDVIYTSHNYENNWPTSQLPQGTYYYIVHTGLGNEVYKGTLLVEK